MRTDITKRFIDPRDGIFCLRAFVNNAMKHQFAWQAKELLECATITIRTQ